MTVMKALLRFPGARKIVLAECPIPSLKPHSVLVRTSKTVISPGTEFTQAHQATASLFQKAWQRPDLVALTLKSLRSDGALQTFARAQNRLGRPLPMGYCGTGIVEAIGDGITDIASGQRVAIGGMNHANHAQWNVIPKHFSCPIPQTVSDEKAAFTTLYALALHALRQGDTGIGNRIAIIGAGLIGQLVLQTALAAGAVIDVIEPNTDRRNIAQTIGANAISDAAQDAPNNQFDTVYICASAQGNHDLIDAAAKLCRDRGVIVCVGDVAPQGTREVLYRKEIDIRQVRSYGPGRYDPTYEQDGQDYPAGYVRWTVNRYMQAALALMQDGRLDPLPLVTREIAFEAIAEHFEQGAKSNDLATLVHFSQNENLSHAADNPAKPTDKSIPHPPQTAPSAKPKGTNTITLGMIGTGNYLGGVLTPIIGKHPDISVRASVSESGLSALALAQKFDGATSCSNAQDIFDNSDINSVIIATRHNSHAELAQLALAAGKHVWLEKPMTIHHDELDLLRPYVATSSSIFMIGHNRRYAPMSQKLRALLPAQAKQFHYRVRFTPVAPDHWLSQSQQGGQTIGEISHFIDLLSYLADADITDITCRWLDRKVGDSIWQIAFADGSVGEVSYLRANRHEAKEILEVAAPGFGATLHDWRDLKVNGKRVMQSWLTKDKGQKNAISSFVTAIQNGKPGVDTSTLGDEISLMEHILMAANR
ncbi:bi-domain-containing oxidoreductase [Thalassospira povalilytica]|uniref:bi-domain-containing oxidoreductase n=1 Tax=Thalassospira povalilytica TaxID=732237 RepID=UPI003AA81623